MAVVKKGLISLVALISFIGAFFTGSPSIHAASGQSSDQTIITEWQMLWEQPGQSLTIEEVSSLSDNDGWFTVHSDGDYPSVPEGINSAWIRFRLPELTQMRPAMEIEKLYAKDVRAYIDENVILDKKRNYSYDLNDLIIPMSKSESNQYVYFYIIANIEGRLGLQEHIEIGESSEILIKYLRKDLVDLVLGGTLICIAFFMLSSILFLTKSFVPGWNSLLLVMLSIGIMILTYSSFLDKFFPELGVIFYYMFDIASAILLPAIFSFFEKIFGKGLFGLITKFKNIQIYFTGLCLVLLLGSSFSKGIFTVYSVVGGLGFGISIIVGNILLIVSLINQCRNKNKEAIILSVGFSLFAGVGLAEMLWFYLSNGMHKMLYWKLSLLFFLTSLIIILVRRVMQNYELAIKYSKQIEIFNAELLRAEKMDMISQLAASIAHEVRNPLQVTRGFLQLLGKKTLSEDDKGYTSLAINELDRASEIITDFLTFAKPDLEEKQRLDVAKEVLQIEGILAPLATMQGTIIESETTESIFIEGNSSRFKQALINIIKNSIEATPEGGTIRLKTFSKDNEVIISVIDNGEGIDAQDIKRLGEPYYSKKSKGTGLGLMVTFRIIEAMDGKIIFTSEKGQGTEVIIRLPIIKRPMI